MEGYGKTSTRLDVFTLLHGEKWSNSFGDPSAPATALLLVHRSAEQFGCKRLVRLIAEVSFSSAGLLEERSSGEVILYQMI